MAREKYYDAKSMCELGQYIDDQYICKLSGHQCNLGMHPNRHDCRVYSKYKYGNKGDSKNGTINGSSNVDI